MNKLKKSTPLISLNDRIPILSNEVAITLVSSYQDASEGGGKWKDSVLGPIFEKTFKTGDVAVIYNKKKPIEFFSEISKDEQKKILAQLRRDLIKMNDLTADVLIISLAHWIQNPIIENGIWVSALQICKDRNLKRPGRNEFERISEAFNHLDHTWLDINLNTWVRYQKDGKTEKKVKKFVVQSKALVISDKVGQMCTDGTIDVFAWKVKPGDEWGRFFLAGEGRKTALLAIKSLNYDPYHEKWEKRLSRFFAFQWRIRARDKTYFQPFKVFNLLDAIEQNINLRYPNKTREKLENALDKLVEDRIIVSWQYVDGLDDTKLKTRGWIKTWLEWSIKVEPCEIEIDHYKNLSDKIQIVKTSIRTGKLKAENIRVIRKEQGLTLMQLAEVLNIKECYLSMIETGKKPITKKVAKKFNKWMDRKKVKFIQ